MRPVRIICPTGHLGTTPLEKGSFALGCEASPDYIIADSGSADIGPFPLGADKAASNEVWQRHDLEAMLLAARRLRIPMIIGSASDTGTNRGVAQFARLIREIAREHKLAPFRLATIESEVPVAELKARARQRRCLARPRRPAGRRHERARPHRPGRGGDGCGAAPARAQGGRRRLHHRTLVGSGDVRGAPARGRVLDRPTPTSAARRWSAPRSAASHSWARRRSSAGSRRTASTSRRCIRSSGARRPRSRATPCTSGQSLPRVCPRRLPRHVAVPL